MTQFHKEDLVSRDLLEDIKKLHSYGFEMESDYVLASPELLTNPLAKDYLDKELLAIGFTQKQLPKVSRLIRNIVEAGATQVLTVKHVPSVDAMRRLRDIGVCVNVTRVNNGSPPIAVTIQTKLGQIAVWMDLNQLETLTDVLNWGIPE